MRRSATGDYMDETKSTDSKDQRVQAIVEKLGCGLHENELWALCGECVKALQTNQDNLPEYVSVDTVAINNDGHVAFRCVEDDKELEVVYLAPELQTFGEVTEKTCLFGVAAMLWSAADYKLPANQEPALSEQLENLLISMTQDDCSLRPSASEVLKVCNEYQSHQNATSQQVCQALAMDARKADEFGKGNALVRDILNEEKVKMTENNKAVLVDSIKSVRQNQLRPVGERRLPDRPVLKSLHDDLMEEITNPPKKLKQCQLPLLMPVQEIFINNPDLMAELVKVTEGLIQAAPVARSLHDGSDNEKQSFLNESNFWNKFENGFHNKTNLSDQPVIISEDVTPILRRVEQEKSLHNADGSSNGKDLQEGSSSKPKSNFISNSTNSSANRYDKPGSNAATQRTQSNDTALDAKTPRSSNRATPTKISFRNAQSNNIRAAVQHFEQHQRNFSADDTSLLNHDKSKCKSERDNFSSDKVRRSPRKSQSFRDDIKSHCTDYENSQTRTSLHRQPQSLLTQANSHQNRSQISNGNGLQGNKSQKTLKNNQSFVGFAISPAIDQESDRRSQKSTMPDNHNKVDVHEFSGLSRITGSTKTNSLSTTVDQQGTSLNKSREPVKRSGSIKSKPAFQFFNDQTERQVKESDTIAKVEEQSNKSDSGIPSAFWSPTTHFTPIIVDKEKYNSGKRNSRNLESAQSDVSSTSRSACVDSAPTRHVGKKFKQIRRNLLRNKTPASLAKDVERDALRKSNSPRRRNSFTFSNPPPANDQSYNSLPRYHTPPSSSPFMHGSLTQLNVGQPSFGTVIPPNSASMRTNIQYASPVPGLIAQTHGAPTSISPAQSLPNIIAPYPYSMFPFSVQLQQDPNTGLFQVIPVPVATMPPTLPASGPQHTTSSGPSQSPFLISEQATKSNKSSSAFNLNTAASNITTVPPSKSDNFQTTFQNQYAGHYSDENSRPQERGIHAVKTMSNRNGTKLQRSQTIGSAEFGTELARMKARRVNSERELRRSCLKVSKDAPVSSLSNAPSKQEFSDSVNTKPKSSMVKDRRVTRTKSVDFTDYLGEIQTYESRNSEFCYQPSFPAFTKSQPNLDRDISSHTNTWDDSTRRRSPEFLVPSPPSSPSWSKDSGVSGINSKLTGDATLMERLLNSDTLRHSQKLTQVIRLLRDEFAFDGYMENGFEDLAIAEYVLSLGNLRWATFSNAITEKYSDLYWQSDLLRSLYESVNGYKAPVTNKAKSEALEKLASQTAQVLSVDEPEPKPVGGGAPGQFGRPHKRRPAYSPMPMQRLNSGCASKNTATSMRSRVERNKYRVDSSDSSEVDDAERKKQQRRKCSEKARSLSSRNKGEQEIQKPFQLPQAKSQGIMKTKPRNAHSRHLSLQNSAEMSLPRTRLIYVKCSESENEAGEKPDDGSEREELFSPHNQSTNSTVSSVSSCQTQRQFGFDYTPGPKESTRLSAPRNISSPVSQYPNGKSRPHSMIGSIGGSTPVSGVGTMSCASTSLRTDEDSDSFCNGNKSPKDSGSQRQFNRSSVVYYKAELEHYSRRDITDFASQIDSRTKHVVVNKMNEIDQEMSVEHRNRRKTLNYYKKLVEATKMKKVANEHKVMLTNVAKQLSESAARLEFLNAAKKHLEMLHAEQWGIDHSFLYALANCPGDEPMQLSVCENPLLQYQVIRDDTSHVEGQVLQAGTPLGLMAYLFAQHALSEGHIHDFFYCYRYFLTPRTFFYFLQDKFVAASLRSAPEESVPAKVKSRALDLLQVWLEGYYSVDFLPDPELRSMMTSFIKEKVIPVDTGAETLLDILEDCSGGKQQELSYPDNSFMRDTCEALAAQGEKQTPKRWESFKAALHLSGKPMKLQRPTRSRVVCLEPVSVVDGEAYFPKPEQQKANTFSLVDHTSQSLAEQLTLMEQELFLQSHPVHYLNSRAYGVGVALSNPVLSKSLIKLNSAWEGQDTNLFLGTQVSFDILQRMIEHAQSVAFWVAAEVVSCSSSKVQVSVLTKFLYTAKLCMEMRNFATCISIVDGLENVIVRQLPAWKNLTSKCISLLEELASLRMFLKSDNTCLTAERSQRCCPTIPSILLFALHIQQLEIGGFTLANGLYKWPKLRAISRVADQIRLFKEYHYDLEPDVDLQAAIRYRIDYFSQQELTTLVAQHDANFLKVSPGNRLQDAFKRVKEKFQGKAD